MVRGNFSGKSRARLASTFDPVFYTSACWQYIGVCFSVCVIDVCFPVCVHVNVATVRMYSRSFGRWHLICCLSRWRNVKSCHNEHDTSGSRSQERPNCCPAWGTSPLCVSITHHIFTRVYVHTPVRVIMISRNLKEKIFSSAARFLTLKIELQMMWWTVYCPCIFCFPWLKLFACVCCVCLRSWAVGSGQQRGCKKQDSWGNHEVAQGDVK